METPDTKQKLLDVSEKLFSELGIAATSLRKIISNAGTNLASIHYHFGSKEALIQEVFARRMEPIDKMRNAMLDDLESSTEGPYPLEDILRAFIEPILKIKMGNKNHQKLFLKLFGKIHSESDEIRKLIMSRFEKSNMRFFEILKQALPDLSDAELMWRFKIAHGAVASSTMPFPELKIFKEVQKQRMDIENILEQIIPFLAAGFRAPTAPSASSGQVK